MRGMSFNYGDSNVFNSNRNIRGIRSMAVGKEGILDGKHELLQV